MGRRSAGNALIKNVDVHPSAGIALSKLAQSGAVPLDWEVPATQITAGSLGAGVTVDQHIAAQTVVDITTAQAKELYSAPVTIVPAPGAGAIILDSVAVFYNYSGAAFGSVRDLLVKYTDGSGTTLATIGSTGFIDQTASGLRSIRGISTIITPAATEPLVLCVATADMTCTGSSTLRVIVNYHTIL